MARTNDLDYLDYFGGGVPAGALFSINLENIEGLLQTTPAPTYGLDPAAEICFIGLIAYFEAFCRDHFASLINICPALVDELKRKGRDVSIDASTLLTLGGRLQTGLGFLLAERYEFGTANSVNSLYTDLVLVTPFSKDESDKFEKLLNDRNLLVHHGGIYTIRYAGQTFTKRRAKQRVFFDSLVIGRGRVRSTASFLTGIAKKTTTATQHALLRYMTDKRIRRVGPITRAIDALVWW
jgi:hypothetical protein